MEAYTSSIFGSMNLNIVLKADCSISQVYTLVLVLYDDRTHCLNPSVVGTNWLVTEIKRECFVISYIVLKTASYR
jgi:hypothetical protein